MSGWVAAFVRRGFGGGEVAAALVPWGFLHQVRQAPREMSWKVLLVTQARARDSI